MRSDSLARARDVRTLLFLPSRDLGPCAGERGISWNLSPRQRHDYRASIIFWALGTWWWVGVNRTSTATAATAWHPDVAAPCSASCVPRRVAVDRSRASRCKGCNPSHDVDGALRAARGVAPRPRHHMRYAIHSPCQPPHAGGVQRSAGRRGERPEALRSQWCAPTTP